MLKSKSQRRDAGLVKFRKKEIEKFDFAIKYIRDEMKTGRDFWLSLGSAGIATFEDDIKRFKEYVIEVCADDILFEILAK